MLQRTTVFSFKPRGVLFFISFHQPGKVKAVISQIETVFARKIAVPFSFFYNDADSTVIQDLERRVCGISLVDATFRNPSLAIVFAHINGDVFASRLAGREGVKQQVLTFICIGDDITITSWVEDGGVELRFAPGVATVGRFREQVKKDVLPLKILRMHLTKLLTILSL